MKILKEDTEHMYEEAKYTIRYDHEEKALNQPLNCWCFLETKETEIMDLTGEALDVILYSKYYWSTRYIEKYKECYGQDAGLEQNRDKILEELEQRLGKVDWEVIQSIEAMMGNEK